MKNEKTNVMRILDMKKAAYTSHDNISTDAISGSDVAKILGKDPRTVFKTLVTVGKSGAYHVFMIPVEAELDVKKAAEAAGEKSVAMIKQKELLPLTGYVHGGCSPIGMKKSFDTVIDISASLCETITFSAGKIGYQVEMTLPELSKALEYKLFPITADNA